MTTNYEERVNEIIFQYLQPNTHLLAAERIYRHLTDENAEFTRWTEVADALEELDWNPERLKEFVTISKQIAEGTSTRISESYFNIVEPDTLTTQRVVEELDNERYEPDTVGEEKTGFQYEVHDNGLISGRYIAVDIETDISYSGDLNSLTKEKAVSFRILPEERLLIVETSSIVDIQRIKSAFGRKTNIDLTVCGAASLDSDENSERYTNFLDSFNGEVTIRSVNSVDLYNSGDDHNDISEMSMRSSGLTRDIFSLSDITDRIDQGWFIKSIEFSIEYDQGVFDITVAGSEKMGYAKIEKINDMQKGMGLMNEIRRRYLDHLRSFDSSVQN